MSNKVMCASEKQKAGYNVRLFAWCSIKNDYRTLVGLEDVTAVESYNDIDGMEGDDE